MTDSSADYPHILASDASRSEERSAKVLAEARKQGADAAEVRIGLATGISVNVRLGELDTLEFHHSRDMVVMVYRGQSKGIASSTDDSDKAIASTVAAALAIAQEAEEDSCAGLAETRYLATDIPELDLHHPWALSVDAAIDKARTCEAAGLDYKGITNSEGAGLSSGAGLTWYANTQGFSQGYSGSNHSMNCVLIAEADNSMQRDYWFDSHCDAQYLEGPEAIGREAAKRSLARLGGRQPLTGNYPVLFAPRVAKSLLGHFVSAISGGNLYRRNSFLCNALGDKIFPDWVTISENPHMRKQTGSAPFDSDGLPTRQQNFVAQGGLNGYALSLYSARRLEMLPTGNGSGVHNLTITDTGQDQQALLQRMGTGLLVTELMGSAVNPITGDYSRGAAGFWVEGGEITHPVEEFTLAGSLQEMFRNLQGSGTDVDHRSRIHCGSLLLAPMKVAGS